MMVNKGGIGAELIEMDPDRLTACLHRLIIRIWETEQLSEEWKQGVICPIYKKGAAYKVLSQIL